MRRFSFLKSQRSISILLNLWIRQLIVINVLNYPCSYPYSFVFVTCKCLLCLSLLVGYRRDVHDQIVLAFLCCCLFFL